MEELCNQYNTTIKSLRQLLMAMQSEVKIKDIVPVVEKGEIEGYTITFTSGNPITIYSGKKPQDGHTPIVGIRQDTNSFWYWTIDDDWMMDGEGEMICVDGVQGITPQLKIEVEYWWISYDEGTTWCKLGTIVSEGTANSMFSEIRQNDQYVYFVFTNGQRITLQKNVGVKKYGVRWSILNNDDLGSRCYDAVGKMSVIGVGSSDGFSDFDSIYPWSEIKRCNIKTNANGSKRIVFEGEPGFSLDGSNGDVFVRIPKFYVEKYVKNGYEYRIISNSCGNVHPAFIEDGKVLNEVFVGAFEGYLNNGLLFSVGGVIPSSNVVAKTFLDAAKAKGDGYTLYDMRMVDALWTLYAVEYGSRNTNQYLGFGFANFRQPSLLEDITIIQAANNTNSVKVPIMSEKLKRFMPIGTNITICEKDQNTILTQAKIISIKDGRDYTEFYFDGNPVDVTTDCFIGSAACTTNFTESCGIGNRLNWHTGRALFVKGKYQDSRNPMRYRWIENIIGSLWHFLPDVSFNALQMYVCNSIKDYEFFRITIPYKPVGDILPVQEDNGQKYSDVKGVNHWINAICNNTFNVASVFGKSYSDDMTSRQAFGGFYYLFPQNVCIVNGGGFDHYNRCNMLTNRAWITSNTRWYLYGARLMYKCID